jgi:hypothetical protein
MPVDATRRIGVARIRGRSEPLIRRGALLLEDALRTASLPGTEHGRLLLIRSLTLGTIRPTLSAATLAHQLEQRVAELARLAVHGDDPRASHAPAVYFHDRLDAVITLIRRLAGGTLSESGGAWYWRQAVPDWRSDVMPEQAGRVLLGSLLNLNLDFRSFSQAFQRLFEMDALDVVLQAVREQDGPALLQRCGWRGSERMDDFPAGQRAQAGVMPFPQTWQPALSRWTARWGPADARSLWLVAVAVKSWRPETAGPSAVLDEAKALLGTIARFVAAPLASPSSPPDEQVARQAVGETGRVVQTDEAAISEETVQDERVSVYTPHAGFWFLIPLLMRAGFSRAIQDHPEWIDTQVPWHLLHSLANRLAIEPSDPVQLWLSDHELNGSRIEVPERFSELSSEGASVVASWRVAMRRWCRLQANLGLANVVQRPGWVLWNKTHVEVWMPLSDVDLRIRRVGLDLDPGWVPWLGRVIRFYFDAERRPHGTGGIAGR